MQNNTVSQYGWEIYIYNLIMHKLCLLFLHHCPDSIHFSAIFAVALKPVSSIWRNRRGPILLWNHLETTTTQFLILLSFISRNNARPAPCSPSSSLPSCVTPSELVKMYAYTLWVALLTRGSRSIFFKAWFTWFTKLTSAAYNENRFPLSSVCFPSNTFVSMLSLEASSNS